MILSEDLPEEARDGLRDPGPYTGLPRLLGTLAVVGVLAGAAVLRILVDELWVGRMDERGEDPHGLRRQDGGDPMASVPSVHQALGALRFWR